MRRVSVQPRAHWQSLVEEAGLIYHTPGGVRYWDESICYHFRSEEIEELESATEELQRLCLAAAQFTLDRGRMDDFAVPAAAQRAVRKAWESEPPSLYGRFDLAYDGSSPPKLLEYNADTPTALLEAAVVQWQWLMNARPQADQFNSIHEKLIDKWRDLKPRLRSRLVHFACMPNHEDMLTVGYLIDTAEQAGLEANLLTVREIGWRANDHTFRDLDEREIRTIFALYPWEWLLKDFPEGILVTEGSLDWIEPIWKMLWSNKALLAILWEMFPGHPNLLPAFLDGPRGMASYVRKPCLGREGANIDVVRDLIITESTDGVYGDGAFVFQSVAPASSFDGQIPVIGSWYITDQGAAGIGIRESEGITTNLARFVPHYFD